MFYWKHSRLLNSLPHKSQMCKHQKTIRWIVEISHNKHAVPHIFFSTPITQHVWGNCIQIISLKAIILHCRPCTTCTQIHVEHPLPTVRRDEMLCWMYYQEGPLSLTMTVRWMLSGVIHQPRKIAFFFVGQKKRIFCSGKKKRCH